MHVPALQHSRHVNLLHIAKQPKEHTMSISTCTWLYKYKEPLSNTPHTLFHPTSNLFVFLHGGSATLSVIPKHIACSGSGLYKPSNSKSTLMLTGLPSVRHGGRPAQVWVLCDCLNKHNWCHTHSVANTCCCLRSKMPQGHQRIHPAFLWFVCLFVCFLIEQTNASCGERRVHWLFYLCTFAGVSFAVNTD